MSGQQITRIIKTHQRLDMTEKNTKFKRIAATNGKNKLQTKYK